MQQVLNDHAFMAEALRQASKGLFTTRTNPRVGCVIVKQNKVIGTGCHDYPGQAHAEIVALNNVVEDVTGATVYVTLEPCSHHGNTPPCVEALVEAKVDCVIAAMQDPNPQVNGNGFAYLEKHGVTTRNGILEAEARELNKGFIKRVTQKRPYVTVKTAISLDGKTSLASGESKWITSPQARLDVQKLRARSCAILTGIDTVIADNPSLTVRLSKQDLNIKGHFEQPIRTIVDTQLRINSNAKLLNLPGKVIIYTASNDEEKLASLNNQNVECVRTNLTNKQINLEEVMSDLAQRGINEVLVEAGPTLVGSLLEQQLTDELIFYIAPHLLGDASKGIAYLPSVVAMQNRVNLKILETTVVGEELKIKAKPILK